MVIYGIEIPEYGTNLSLKEDLIKISPWGNFKVVHLVGLSVRLTDSASVGNVLIGMTHHTNPLLEFW